MLEMRLDRGELGERWKLTGVLSRRRAATRHVHRRHGRRDAGTNGTIRDLN